MACNLASAHTSPQWQLAYPQSLSSRHIACLYHCLLTSVTQPLSYPELQYSLLEPGQRWCRNQLGLALPSLIAT